MDSISLMTVLTVAFLGSIGHCSGMCGGFIVAYSSSKIDGTFSKLHQLFSHLSYNVGRVVSYTFLGVIFGFLGSVVSVSMQTKGALFIVVAILMVLMGLSLLGKSKFLNSIEFSIDSNSFFKRSFARLIKSKSQASFFLLGVLNGFIPCGFVYFFLATAVATTSAFYGGLVMFVFGVATVPILFAMGYFIGFLKSSKFRDIMMKVASITIIAYGLFTGFKAIMLLQGKMPMKNGMMMQKEMKSDEMPKHEGMH
jgi:sulfite exporter TauE/SafE